MSYSFTMPMGFPLGEDAPTSCADAAVTGVKMIDAPIVKCCEKIQQGSGSAGDKAKGVALCIKDGIAVGMGSVAGAATGAAICAATGVGAAVAPLCGIIGAAIGGWIGGRVAGYSTGGTIAFIAGTAICGPACGLVLGELTEFFSDNLGPVIDGIFNPGAANEREHARRSAEQAAYWASEKSMREAEEITIKAWSASVNRIWDLFEGIFRTKTARADAAKALGITAGAMYPSIVANMIAIGVQYGRLPDETLNRYRKSGQPGCEIYGKKVDGYYGQISPLCPPFWLQRFLADPRTRNSATAPAVAAELATQINDFFKQLQFAEITLSTRIATYAATQKAAALMKSNNDIDGFVRSAVAASERAQAAAKQAQSTSSVTDSELAAQRAQLAADTAERAVKAIMLTGMATGTKAGERGTTAFKAMEAAKQFAVQAEAAHEANKRRRTGLIFVGLAAVAGTGAYLYATR